ncbi:putative RING-H2 finger protein ATL21A [Salvia hispanica]|uniref:putative RING-H2 finger protein ATL21A n=1 Tax=Salvia hispanica TaxID=49212 RepID=UPI002009A29D|nr:putative RING-H2 finger protein ATL21A [Salvia hispanica]
MNTAATLFLTLSIIPSLSAAPCDPQFCDAALGPEIRFPFSLPSRQPPTCGLPGFDLRCSSQNQTILTLPHSGSFAVNRIDYAAQIIHVDDPSACLPARILNFSVSGSPFLATYERSYAFLNCSSDFADFDPNLFTPLYCLGAVLAMRSDAAAPVPAACVRAKSVEVPLDLGEDLELLWNVPVCWICENEGGICGLDEDGEGSGVACFRRSKSALSTNAKYGIILGLGIPGVLCIMGITCYACGLIQPSNLRHRLESELPMTISDQRPVIRSASGLDGPTIQSYPTMVLGESRRLPKASDVCCPICLSDYQPKETLKSIPECNHYFHAECVDEWLKLNGSCPVCRTRN